MLSMYAALLAVAPPRELADYVRRPDPAFAHRVEERDARQMRLSLTSGTWQGRPWAHNVLVRQPARTAFPNTAILYITGDGPRDGDRRDLALVTEAVGMPTAMLFDVPNQPLFEKREDDLIAHTFERYLATGDSEWPLLFPMTRAALRAMDAVVAETKNTPNPIRRFIVTGASKRGWTTWLVGALNDPRVLGIAPMVFDNLNFAAQMPHQIGQWGRYSEMIEDYSRRGLQAQLGTPRGRALLRLVDPYAYRDRLHVPTLIVNGSNDAYWTADAFRLYGPGLRIPPSLLTVPNVGHDLGGGLQAVATIGAFARTVAGGDRLPKLDSRVQIEDADGKRAALVNVTATGDARFGSLRVWVAESDTTDFRKARYEVRGELESDAGFASGAVRVPLSRTRPSALFAEVRFRQNGRQYSLSTPTRVVR